MNERYYNVKLAKTSGCEAVTLSRVGLETLQRLAQSRIEQLHAESEDEAAFIKAISIEGEGVLAIAISIGMILDSPRYEGVDEFKLGRHCDPNPKRS